jgi:valyl-tRNA synthetase
MENANTTRRDRLMAMEGRAQGIWNRQKYFNAEVNSKPKFFETFPYPYMNGDLHLGHAFSMTKCDFLAWYKRLQGFNVLFPFGYHCTGKTLVKFRNAYRRGCHQIEALNRDLRQSSRVSRGKKTTAISILDYGTTRPLPGGNC